MLRTPRKRPEHGGSRASKSLEGVSENIVGVRVHPVGASSTTISNWGELNNGLNK